MTDGAGRLCPGCGAAESGLTEDHPHCIIYQCGTSYRRTDGRLNQGPTQDCLHRQLAARERELEDVGQHWYRSLTTALDERDTARREADNHRAAWRKENTRAERLREERDAARQDGDKLRGQLEVTKLKVQRLSGLRDEIKASLEAGGISRAVHPVAGIKMLKGERDAAQRAADECRQAAMAAREREKRLREAGRHVFNVADDPERRHRAIMDIRQIVAEHDALFHPSDTPREGEGVRPTPDEKMRERLAVEDAKRQLGKSWVATPDGGRVVEALALARSMILGREPMTPKAQQVIDEALASLQKGGAR